MQIFTQLALFHAPSHTAEPFMELVDQAPDDAWLAFELLRRQGRIELSAHPHIVTLDGAQAQIPAAEDDLTLTGDAARQLVHLQVDGDETSWTGTLDFGPSVIDLGDHRYLFASAWILDAPGSMQAIADERASRMPHRPRAQRALLRELLGE